MRNLSFACIISLLSLPFLCSFQFLANAENFDISASCGPDLLSSSDLADFNNTNVLRVLVPWKVGFTEFVSFNTTSCHLDGFSIQIFHQALRMMGSPHIQIFLHGNGIQTPIYNDMVEMVVDGIADAIVGDLTITKDRMEKLGFTIPYIPTKLVMVTPWYKSKRHIWGFLRPLSKELWLAFVLFFIITGYTLYTLEYNNPYFDSSKQPNANETTAHPSSEFHFFDRGRIMNSYWFTSLCVIASQGESVRTHLGRFVTLLWLLVMFVIFKSSYTASLTSLLSAQKPYPLVKDLYALLDNDKVNVGCQEGSFLCNYFVNKTHIQPERVKNYSSNEGYKHGLQKGSKNNGVDVVLDELAYLKGLLQSNCEFTMTSIDGQLPNFGGFGFAFSKSHSNIINDMSKEIVFLAENKTIKKLQSDLNIGGEDYMDQCSSPPLGMRSFAGLFGIVAIVYIVCIGGRLLQKAL